MCFFIVSYASIIVSTEVRTTDRRLEQHATLKLFYEYHFCCNAARHGPAKQRRDQPLFIYCLTNNANNTNTNTNTGASRGGECRDHFIYTEGRAEFDRCITLSSDNSIAPKR